MVTLTLVLVAVLLVCVLCWMVHVSATSPLWYLWFVFSGSFEVVVKCLFAVVEGIVSAVSE